ncbi:nuclear transport factor 2 family protein [Pedobacter nutrimenti]|uniref:nuclear transport factor 2 family protein n=1 Tax=Pedobacter nutrimenti TaxID=1241337 RepID=UPI002930C1B8|nr:nuclear transport factor 2 family protein [Pedobacter nutrimenti]
MTTQELADRYYELFKSRQVPEIYQQLYSADIVCTEPEHALVMGVPTVTKGIEAVLAKSKARQETIAEVHSFFSSEPVVGGDYFSLAMGRDMTLKNGQRVQLAEIAVFGVKDDKIITETFFY